uniref:Uncharacterized protein n=1 Tax=Rhizophora mucronata TaxID=61149 RepID=A0A2P2LC66_RHIMU
MKTPNGHFLEKLKMHYELVPNVPVQASCTSSRNFSQTRFPTSDTNQSPQSNFSFIKSYH